MVRLKGFQKLTSIDDALHIFSEKLDLKKPRVISVLLDLALHRVSAEPIRAGVDLPSFDRSAVDGYAIKAEDTVGASQFKPKILTRIEGKYVNSKEAKQVWTGHTLPKDADAVVMLENTKQVDNAIEIWMPLAPGENVSKRGEDIKKGEIAIESQIRLKPQHLGLMAALGITGVKVFEKPKIAILVTGNELVEIGDLRREDKIFDVNRHVISALCRELDAEPLDLGITEDDEKEIEEKLKAGLTTADAIITTGGTSVGASDLVPETVNNLGKPGVVVHGIAMRPAMPTGLAIVNQKPILILSGNPVAAMIGFEVFARPLISKMLGLKKTEPRSTAKATMTRKATTALGRKTFVRVHVFQKDHAYLAEPVSARGSGIISTMTKANGYAIAQENREGLAEGETVIVHMFDNIEKADEHV